MKALYSILLICFLAAGCKKGTKETGDVNVTLTGIVKVQSFTTYQYGTHTITNIDQFYALKSSTVSLDDYKDKSVTLTGRKIKGYPVDGGPEYLNVISIKLQ